jgi:hypothetical protein
MRRSKTGWHLAMILWLLWGMVWPGFGPAAHEAHAAEGGNIWYVKEGGSGAQNGTSWNDAFATLQDALDAAEENDEIWIANGTYHPTGYQIGSDKRTRHFQMKKGVAIYGGFEGTETNRDDRDIGNNPTILSGDLGDGENAYHVFYHENLDLTGAILDGVTITGGNADIWPHDSGGGMYNYQSNPTLRNVRIVGNHAVYGGGMYNENSSPTMTNVAITGNSADSDGGGMANINSSLTLTNVMLDDNHADYGGGMYNFSSSPTLTNVTITDNSANSDGGGMYNLSSSPKLTNVTITGNSANDYGGGMHNTFGGSPILTNVTIAGNHADYGGGMGNTFSSPILTNVTIAGNRAYSGGGDVYLFRHSGHSKQHHLWKCRQ